MRFVRPTSSITPSGVAPAQPSPIVARFALPVFNITLKSVLKLSLGSPDVWLASIFSVISLPPSFQSLSGS
jgi:hypothetical protein